MSIERGYVVSQSFLDWWWGHQLAPVEERFAQSASYLTIEDFEFVKMTGAVAFSYEQRTWHHPRTGAVWYYS